jgi:preprotein translocase subunit SecE
LSPFRISLPQRAGQTAVTKPNQAAVRPAPKAPAKSPAKENRLVRWYRETESELKKVVWPTRREWVNLTTVVLVTMVAMGVFLGMVDFIFERLILMIR